MTEADAATGSGADHGLGSSFSEVTEMVAAETTAGGPIPVDDSVAVVRGVSPEILEGTERSDDLPSLLRPEQDA